MGKLAEALRAIIDSPDDLSTLPGLVEKVAEMETAEEDYLTRIASLQEINKSYLAQIPIAGVDDEEEEEEEEATIEAAKEQIINLLGGQR